MLRTLRNRRRPRYGAQLCAIAAALLLLLSVSILHSRLGVGSQQLRSLSSSSSSSRSGLGFPSNLEFSQDATDDIDAIVVNPLLEDNVENDVTAGNNGDEDRIDELDVVEEETDDQSRVSDEEEILRGVEFEEESAESDGSDSNSRNKHSSDYVWDHVVGVTRRAFDTRSVDPWEDSSGFDFSSEDKSKIAFGSDDQPVDDEVRRKLDEIRMIEDALLLKTNDKGGVSPLREGWATWFEKKGDFLRRDRMFKSNLELLNPLSNPLLQDPDGIGLTSLTRGDKLMQKALLNEFRKLPVVVKKPYVVATTKETKFIRTSGGAVDAKKKKKKRSGSINVEENELKKRVVGRMNEVKRVERRTLDDNGSSVVADGKNIVHHSESSNSIKQPTDTAKEQGLSSSSKTNNGQLDRDNNVEGSDRNLESKAQVQLELSGHLYADGKRWGYFPGLDSDLSFSDFMNDYFRQGNCSMRVFMIWNSPPWMYSVRHQRGLESLLYHHPDACVTVFSETIELDFFKDFLKDGFKIAVAMPNLDELLKSTPTDAFASVWFEWRKTNFYSTHYSELIRLAALYKYGGLYLDSDVIVLKPLSSINDFVSMDNQLTGSNFSGAAMAFRKHSPFIMECLKEFYSTYDETRLRWNGADLLSRVGKQFVSRDNISDNHMELKMQPSSIFFPIGRQNITRYFIAPADEHERAQQDIFYRKILNESFVFHFWNSLTSNLVPESESLVARLLNQFCLRCLDVL